MAHLFNELLSDIVIPRFVPVRYEMDADHIGDIPAAVHEQLQRPGTLDRIREGDSVCITASSREVANQAVLLKALADEIKTRGAHPFVIPAMGSHAGASAEGQEAFLKNYGITEETIGCPVRSSMETDVIATSEDGLEIHIDRYANEADFIVVFGRIKAHTDFRGAVESGICKMLVIGMGKQHGAYQCHALGFKNMARNVYGFASKILEKKQNLFAFGTIENAFHDTCRVAAIPHECILEEEPALLEYAKSRMGHIPFEKADVLYVDEAGKDISGAGMDPNVTGRSPVLGVSAPFFERIAVFQLTPVSHGNFAGVGNADVTTQRLFDQISFEQTYPNGITSAEPLSVKIPVVMNCDKTAMQFAIRTSADIDRKTGPKIVWIKNTLKLETFYISEALLKEAGRNPAIQVAGEAFEVPFDDTGAIDRNRLPGF